MNAGELGPRDELAVNAIGRDLFIGDVHGELPLLERCLTLAGFDPLKDRLIFVGDLVDRGWGSMETVEWMMERPYPVYCVQGNHDVGAAAILLPRLGGEFPPDHDSTKWASRYNSETQRRNRLKAVLEYLNALPLTLTVRLKDGRRAGVVHAMVPIGMTWERARQSRVAPEDVSGDGVQYEIEDANAAEIMIWGRRRANAAMWLRHDPLGKSISKDRYSALLADLAPIEGIDLCICGHQVFEDPPSPFQIGQHLFLDTGSGYKAGWLSIVDPVSRECWRIRRAKRNFKEQQEPLRVMELPKARDRTE